MNTDIDSIRQYIVDHFHFSEANYPPLAKLSKEEQFIFAVRHCALHFAKTAGKVVASSEAADHGEPLALQDLKVSVAKSLITTLRLSQLLDMTSEELLALVKNSFSH